MSTGSRLLLVAVFLSLTADAQFTANPGIPIVGNPCCVAVGDFNGDDKPDIAVLNSSSGTVTILLGNGSGGFSAGPGSPLAAGYLPAGMTVGDFNGDGKLDLAVAGATGITVLIGTGSGGFTSTPVLTIIGSGFGSLVVGDFNGDGKLDLAASSTNFGGTVSILLGNGSGGFNVAPGSPFLEESYPFGVAVGDFNGDGKLDLAIAMGTARAVTILLGDGTGRVTSSNVIPLPSSPSDMQAADFNRDGKMDLVVAVGRSLIILLNDGSGGFTAAAGGPLALAALPHALAIADFNGDGKLDIAIADRSSGLSVFLGDGSGGFAGAAGSPFASGTFPYTVAAGDFNGDGKPDLVIASGITSSVTALLNAYPGYACTNTAAPVIASIVSASAFGGYSYFTSGSWLEIKGTNLADPADPRNQWTADDFGGANAPISLDGIRVSINGKPAYVWYISPTQLNVQAPQDSATGNVAVIVTNCRATSVPFTIARQPLAPGLLTVATFANGAYVSSTNPAKPGDVIIAYGVGFGDVTPAILPGVIAGQSNSLVNAVTFAFGSTTASASYAGLAVGFVGLYEFYITVPSLANGDYQINATQNGIPVPHSLTVTVHN